MPEHLVLSQNSKQAAAFRRRLPALGSCAASLDLPGLRRELSNQTSFEADREASRNQRPHLTNPRIYGTFGGADAEARALRSLGVRFDVPATQPPCRTARLVRRP